MKTRISNKTTRIIIYSFSILYLSLFFISCNPFVTRFIAKSFEGVGSAIDTVAAKIEQPIYSRVGLSVLWIGHSTFLIQIGDKVFLTDPVFTNSVGIILKRKTEAGLLPSSINKLDYVLISHLHFDHFSYGSLEDIPKTAVILLPNGGLRYTPDFGFSDYKEMTPWTTIEADGVRITAVPVKHFNGRYGFDNGWLNYDTYTGYIIEYQGKTIFFAGDTGYDKEKFKVVGEKFNVDVALLPIAPIEPRNFMRRVHTDAQEALQVFEDVRAKIMIPMHHLTFAQGLDSTLAYAQNQLNKLAEKNQVEDRVLILKIGEQKIIYR